MAPAPLLVLAMIAIAPGALGGPPRGSVRPEVRAAELKRAGDQAMDTVHYDEALSAYTEAYELTHEPALLYNRGRALQALGRYPEALVEFERFLEVAPPELRARVAALPELVREVRVRVALLTVRSNVAGARVLLRDQAIGVAPLSDVRVVAGDAVVEVIADGYQPFRTTVHLEGGGSAEVDATLGSRTNGTLVVAAVPEGALVRIDGHPSGRTPLELPLSPGLHAVHVSKDGFDDASVTADVGAGGRRELRLSLEPRAPLTSRWWFWTGVGVLVVGGVVATAAILSEGAPSSGDIAPGRVAGPLRF